MPDRPRLVRAIGRWDFTALVVNGVIGSGIFGLPAVLAGLTGAWSPLAYLLAGIGMLAVVLCHAEVASRFMEPGGPYLYAREAFGPFVGVQAGWLSFCIRVTSLGANLNIFADYLAQILREAGQGRGRVLTLFSVTAVVTLLNVIGVRTGARTVDVFVVAKILPLLLLVILALPRFSSVVVATQHVETPDWTQAILLLVFAYGGFEAALIPAGEVKDPRRDSAFALLVGMGVVAVLYMLVQVAVLGVLPHAARHPAPVAAAYGVLLGPAGVTLGSLAAMVSTYGWTHPSALPHPACGHPRLFRRRARLRRRGQLRGQRDPGRHRAPGDLRPGRGQPPRVPAAGGHARGLSSSDGLRGRAGRDRVLPVAPQHEDLHAGLDPARDDGGRRRALVRFGPGVEAGAGRLTSAGRRAEWSAAP